MTTTTISVMNQKGGSGKTSTCFHLAGALAETDHRTLLIDIDPQGSLSQGFLGPSLVESLPAELTTASILDEESSHHAATRVIRQTEFDGVASPTVQDLRIMSINEMSSWISRHW